LREQLAGTPFVGTPCGRLKDGEEQRLSEECGRTSIPLGPQNHLTLETFLGLRMLASGFTQPSSVPTPIKQILYAFQQEEDFSN
jgi:hypothetical protein